MPGPTLHHLNFDEHGLGRVEYCGVSLGGAIGMCLGLSAPERVSRLVLACMPPQVPPPSLWAERAELVRAQGTETVADGAVARWFTPGFHERRPEVVRRYRDMVAATTGEGYARCCEALRDFDLRAELGRISAPTTVVIGRHDPVISDEGRAALARIPGVRTIELDAAHLACAEQPDAFDDAVLA